MLFHKPVDQWNHIVIPYRNTAVIFHIFIADLAIIVHDQLRRKTVTIHIVIIAHVILRKHKRYFTRRKQNFPAGHVSILIHFRQIINADHDVTLFIHALCDLVKFIDRSHHLIIISGLIVSVKSLRSIFDQGMIKHMRHLFRCPGHTGIFFLLINLNCLLELLTCLISRTFL